MADVSAAANGRRIAVRELIPWLGLILSWLLVALAVGADDAARLFAAWAIVRSIRFLTAANYTPAIRQRLPRTGDLDRQSARLIGTVALSSLIASIALLALVVLLLWTWGAPNIAQLVAVIGLGLPARYAGPFARRRRIPLVTRWAASWSAALFVLLAWLADAPLAGIAVAFAAREWAALALALLLAPTRPGKLQPLAGLTLAQIAGPSAELGRRRLNYRVGKALLVAAFGPFGIAVARSGRAMRLDSRINRHLPQGQPALAILAVLVVAAVAGLLLISRDPAVLVAAASLTTIAAVAVNILFWSNFAGAAQDVDPDDDEDD